jgi:hypothetical protein
LREFGQEVLTVSRWERLKKEAHFGRASEKNCAKR